MKKKRMYTEEQKERNRERHREWSRKRYAEDPEFRARAREQVRKRYAEDPEYRARQRERCRERKRKRYAEDPEYRAKKREWERKRQTTPEYRAKKREWDRKRLTTPEYRAKKQERERKRQKTPEYRAKRRELTATPKFRATKRKYSREYVRKRRVTDPLFKLIDDGRRRRRKVTKTLRDSILAGGPLCSPKGFKALLGCSPEEYKRHIESQFTEGMTWENHGTGEGKWNIDHIRPLASFDHVNDSQWEEKAWHYTNLRPLWSKDNFSKNSVWEGKRHRYGDGEPTPERPDRPTLPFED